MRVLLSMSAGRLASLLSRVLASWGYQPELLSNADATAELTLPGGTRLALLEAEPELFRQVRDREGQDRPYLIALSTSAAGPSAAESLAAGADDYVGGGAGLAELQARLDAGRRVLAWQARVLDRWAVSVTEAPEESPLITVCACCKKVRSPGGTWEPFCDLLPRFAKRCTHGFCPSCYDDMVREAEAQLAAMKGKTAKRRADPAWN